MVNAVRRSDGILSKIMWLPFVVLLLVPVLVVHLLYAAGSIMAYRAQVIHFDYVFPFVALAVLLLFIVRFAFTVYLWESVKTLDERSTVIRGVSIIAGLLLLYIVSDGLWANFFNPLFVLLLHWHLIGLPPR